MASPMGLPNCKLVYSGADVDAFEAQFLGRPVIIKQYKDEDKAAITARIKTEVRSIIRVRKLGLRTPALLNVDLQAGTICLAKCAGKSVDVVLREGIDAAERGRLLVAIARLLGSMHDAGLVHGAFDTKNLLVEDEQTEQPKLSVIGFRHAHQTIGPEDKAGDLTSLEATLDTAVPSASKEQAGGIAAEAGAALQDHVASEAEVKEVDGKKRKAGEGSKEHSAVFTQLLEEYRQRSKQWSAVFNRLEPARIRARKRAKGE